ncbi:MAG: hypothetical protein JO132_13345 [Streptosporangiaceae bacterium]|nr:hypothetical protein [Streptosporangiaceae bacterium]
MSSAILYAAIVAIWACVLIPRWLHRDTSAQQPRGNSEEPTAQEPGPTEQEPGPAEHRPRPWARHDKGGDEAVTGNAAPEDHPDRTSSPRDFEHARVLAARRRLFGLLAVLSIASLALAYTRMAAWWVVVPPLAMMAGYLAVLRAAAKADAERREMARTRAAQQVRAAARAAVPLSGAVTAAPDAEVIHISPARGQRQPADSGSAKDQADEELYDQYADAKLRAVGD